MQSRCRHLFLKQRLGKATLADDGLKSADSDFSVQRDGDGDRASVMRFLHNGMTTVLPDTYKAMPFKKATYVLAGKDPKLRHEPPQNA